MEILKTLLSSTAKFTLITIIFIGLVALNWKMWSKDRDQEQKIRELQKELLIQQQENAKMNSSNAKLRQRINSLKRGSVEMIEEKARDNFSMVSEGETFFDFQATSDKKKQ